ncbi:MAG: hypothetical protein SGCHY_005148 [Lobulomycetales sp.]
MSDHELFVPNLQCSSPAREASRASTPVSIESPVSGSLESVVLTEIFQEANASVFHVKQEYWDQAKRGIRAEIARLELTAGSTKVPMTGSRVIAQSTETQYQRVVKAVRQVACYTGDYASMLVLLDRPPVEKCPSVDPKLLTLVVFYKAEHNKGKELKDQNGNTVYHVPLQGQEDQPVTPIICAGGWKAESNYFHLKSGMTAVHQARHQRGAYSDKCETCWTLWTNGDQNGWYD